MEEVRHNGTLAARYKYLADGTKLEVSDALGGGYLYFGSLIYHKLGDRYEPESVGFSGGRIVGTSTGSQVRYHVTDYLGSVHVVADADGKRLEKCDYYPFGKRIEEVGQPLASNRYLFNGKEWQAVGGVNLLDYGARMYDPNLGRWFCQDPEYQSINPYAYCYNNPVRFIDPDGRKIFAWASDTKRYYEWKLVNNKWGFYDSQNNLYDGTDPEMLKLQNSLNLLISGGASGFLLVCNVVASEKSIEIKFSKNSYYNSESSTLFWLPNPVKNTHCTVTRNGIENYVPFIGLAHELAHALNDINGQSDVNPMWVYNDGNNMEAATYDEIFATQWENKIRAEHGFPLRTHYFQETGNGSLLIDSQNRALYMNIKERISYNILNPKRRYQY